jgi:hypothetical protein
MKDQEMLSDVCKELGILLVAFPVPWRPDGFMSDDKHLREHYLIALKIKGSGGDADKFQTFGYFTQGAFDPRKFSRGESLKMERARKDHAPKVADVLGCLASDASGADRRFGEWVGDFGYDITSHAEYKKARRTWKACKRTRKLLAAFLGREAFDRVLNAEH